MNQSISHKQLSASNSAVKVQDFSKTRETSVHKSDRGSIFNMRVAGSKIEKLKDPDCLLNEEERQELIYSILLE